MSQGTIINNFLHSITSFNYTTPFQAHNSFKGNSKVPCSKTYYMKLTAIYFDAVSYGKWCRYNRYITQCSVISISDTAQNYITGHIRNSVGKLRDVYGGIFKKSSLTKPKTGNNSHHQLIINWQAGMIPWKECFYIWFPHLGYEPISNICLHIFLILRLWLILEHAIFFMIVWFSEKHMVCDIRPCSKQ